MLLLKFQLYRFARLGLAIFAAAFARRNELVFKSQLS